MKKNKDSINLFESEPKISIHDEFNSLYKNLTISNFRYEWNNHAYDIIRTLGVDYGSHFDLTRSDMESE